MFESSTDLRSNFRYNMKYFSLDGCVELDYDKSMFHHDDDDALCDYDLSVFHHSDDEEDDEIENIII